MWLGTYVWQWDGHGYTGHGELTGTWPGYDSVYVWEWLKLWLWSWLGRPWWYESHQAWLEMAGHLLGSTKLVMLWAGMVNAFMLWDRHYSSGWSKVRRSHIATSDTKEVLLLYGPQWMAQSPHSHAWSNYKKPSGNEDSCTTQQHLLHTLRGHQR